MEKLDLRARILLSILAVTFNFMLTVVYTMLQLPFCTSLSYMPRDAKKRAHIIMFLYSAAGVTFQSEGAIHMIYNRCIWGIVVLCAAMVVVLMFYKLDYEYDGMMAELLEREKRQSAKMNHAA